MSKPASKVTKGVAGRRPRGTASTVPFHPEPCPSVLVIHRDPRKGESAVRELRQEGCRVDLAPAEEEARVLLRRHRYDVVVLEAGHPEMKGIETMEHELGRHAPEWIIMAPLHHLDGAPPVSAEIYSYVRDAFHPRELVATVCRAAERRRLRERIRLLECRERDHPFDSVAGSSEAMIDIFRVVEQVARLDSPVLISGERGIGKETMARLLHRISRRRDHPFVAVRCDALPADVQEAKLFGHSKNGPSERGLLEEAHRGTLFLERVEHLTPQTQLSILRFLEHGRAIESTSPTPHALDVRVVAATHHALEQSVEEKRFREDLFYRLNVIPIHLPPLRKRPEDIPRLVAHFVVSAAALREDRNVPAVSAAAMAALLNHSWPGNIREVKNTIERAVHLDRDGVIGLDDLPWSKKRSDSTVVDRVRKNAPTLRELQREYILDVLAEFGGSRKKAAERLGITTATLWRKLKRYQRGEF